MEIRIRDDAWYPTEHVSSSYGSSLTAGQLVIWDRRGHRVIEVREREETNWPEKFRNLWVDQGMPDPKTWSARPFIVVVRPEDQPDAKPLHLLGSANSMWRVLPEHYAVCRLCAEIPPCRHVHNETIAERATERFEKEMSILPGMCHACREPITQRQKSVRFTGPNLIRPDLGDDSAVFHLRSKCFNSMYAYDERWAKATGNPRRFYCEGHRTVHQGGEQECTELAACPGDVDHRMTLWHHPEGARGGKYGGCWCLVNNLLSDADSAGAT